MLSGICPRGSSNAPASGNTGITSARSAGFAYTAFIGMAGSPLEEARRHGRELEPESREQDRGQPLAAADGRLVGRTPSLEKLHELLARAVVVPFAVALDDLDEIVDRLCAASLAVQGDREIEARLMIERIGG